MTKELFKNYVWQKSIRENAKSYVAILRITPFNVNVINKLSQYG